ncbi:MAG: GNAT family N-acetyltransferase [Trueperaceae bacterium]
MPAHDASEPPLRSLGLRTEALFVEEVRPVGSDAVRFACPREPTFRWGNLLIVRSAPGPDDVQALEDRFDAAFDDLPAVRHRTFTWDDPQGREGAIAAWSAAGYRPDRNAVRAARADDLAEPPRAPDRFGLRAVVAHDDWRTVTELPAAEPGEEEPAAYLAFRRGRAAFYRRLAGAPDVAGGWFLATIEGRPAGCLGLYVRAGLGRFQQVFVAPEFRRRGVASAMVHAVARIGFASLGAERLVIIANEGEPADGLYARLGFRQIERWVGVSLADRDARRGPA